MANIIEQLLEEKSRGTACEVFFTQWLLAKDYVPKVQSIIIRTFPHYSRHDASHSESILNCIVRILGKDSIATLGPVDLWLLLAAAYYHDIGMAVFAKDLEEVFRDKEFYSFVQDCQKNPDNSLYPFASVYDVKDDGLFYKNVALDGKTVDCATFLLAEYVRKQHAKRSKDALSSEESVHLAGDPIPNRLIRLLGRICETHTCPFQEIMSLPICESGLGLDDCHPRFIACMLRLGDLLDLDNNRFSSILLRSLPSIPRDSLLHKDRHFAIDHLRIDSSRIEATARCDNYEVADISNRWFEMISDEFRRQRDVWYDIVPPGFSGYLPSVGELKVNLIGFDTIDGKKRPGFEIDTSKAIEMLQGAGLYTRPAQCIRELLQNAVDATYVAIYLEHGSIPLDDFLDKCAKKEIGISIDKGDEDGNDLIWHVEIEDNGVGMSREDLRFLFKTGSKNPDKARIVESMPEYMRPSGTFGIGFQSVFLLTDKVQLTTRKMDSSEVITAELFNPAGPRRGAVLLKSGGDKMHYGTKLKFDFRSDKNLNHWSISFNEIFATHAVYSYDFVTDKSLDMDTAKVLDEIRLFSRVCPVKLTVDLDSERINMPHLQSNSFDYYSKKQGMQLSILSSGVFELFYRNQEIAKPGFTIPFLDVRVNILGGNAKDLLSLNRDELRYQAKDAVRKRVCDTIEESIVSDYNSLNKSVLPSASMFMHVMASNRQCCPELLVDAWKEYVLYYFDGQKKCKLDYTLGEIVAKANDKPVVWLDDGINMAPSIEENNGALIVYMGSSDPNVSNFLKKQLFKSHPFPHNVISKYTKRNGFLLSTIQVDPIGDYYKWAIGYLSHDFYARSLMPCNPDYKVLQVKPDSDFRFSYDATFAVSGYPQMICPYVRECRSDVWQTSYDHLEWNDGDGELYRLTFEKRMDSAVTMDDIRGAFAKFREMMDPIVKRINNKRKNNSGARRPN